MDTHTAAIARGATSKRTVGRPGKGAYKAYSIKARLDLANELERLAHNGVTRTELFEAAAAIALRDEEALLAEVQAQREKADEQRLAAGLPPRGGDRDVAA